MGAPSAVVVGASIEESQSPTTTSTSSYDQEGNFQIAESVQPGRAVHSRNPPPARPEAGPASLLQLPLGVLQARARTKDDNSVLFFHPASLDQLPDAGTKAPVNVLPNPLVPKQPGDLTDQVLNR